MNIVFCTDKRYIIPCGVMMTSLCENNKEDFIKFFCIVDGNVDETDKMKLKKISQKYGHTIEFLTFNSPALESLPIKDNVRYTKSVYYRLFFSEIFPKDMNKILFLDGDIIINHSLHELWDTDIEKYALGAIPDMTDGNMEYYNRLKYSSHEGYFNGGVLLINLDYWRKNNVQNRFLDFCKNYPERIVWNDQDVMNYVLRNEKLNLHLKYNVQHGFFWKNNMNFEWNRFGNQFFDAIKKPVIIHYNCTKPWIKECDHPYKNAFTEYLNLTEWKNTKIDYRANKTKIIDIIKEYAIKILISLKLKTPKRNIYFEI